MGKGPGRMGTVEHQPLLLLDGEIMKTFPGNLQDMINRRSW